MDIYEESLKLHEEKKGKMEITSKVPLKTRKDLSLAYTPGVARPCIEISKDKNLAYKYTIKSNTVAVITDGSAVLGLGNIGALAGLPVMEGKAILFKEFAGVDAFPICIETQDTEKIIEIIKNISPVFGGINLEDIASPRCFEIEERLQDLGIPVFHDDQHGTAIVILAALINASKVAGKKISDLQIVISGAGAAGIAITKLLLHKEFNVKNVILCDTKGIISNSRTDLNDVKKEMVKITNKDNRSGMLSDALFGADVFIGVSGPGVLKKEMIKDMNEKPIIFAMANPIPEIMPDDAKEGGAFIIGTGRSDFPNQINNVLAFPGIFRGALDIRAKRITEEMKIAAAKALASYVKDPTVDNIMPSALDKEVAKVVAEAVRKCKI